MIDFSERITSVALRQISSLISKISLFVFKIEKSKIETFVLVSIFLIHATATCSFFPPREILRVKPLYHKDHSVHTHRVHLYRQALLESGLPWGYDPFVAAGMVMRPSGDAGAKPHQVLGVILFFLPPGTVVRLFLFVVVLILSKQ